MDVQLLARVVDDEELICRRHLEMSNLVLRDATGGERGETTRSQCQHGDSMVGSVRTVDASSADVDDR